MSPFLIRALSCAVVRLDTHIRDCSAIVQRLRGPVNAGKRLYDSRVFILVRTTISSAFFARDVEGPDDRPYLSLCGVRSLSFARFVQQIPIRAIVRTLVQPYLCAPFFSLVLRVDLHRA